MPQTCCHLARRFNFDLLGLRSGTIHSGLSVPILTCRVNTVVLFTVLLHVYAHFFFFVLCSFEQEILTPHSASDLPRVIIGSSTYNQVSAQLKKLREATGSSFGSNEERERKAKEVSAQLKLLRAQTELATEKELSDTEGSLSGLDF